jgi:hypothetical protein
MAYSVIDKAHGLWGPFETLSAARACAEDLTEWQILDDAGKLIDWLSPPKPFHSTNQQQ